MNKVFIANPLRTATGSFNGMISGLSAVELGSEVIKGILNDSEIAPGYIDEAYIGNVLQAGAGQNPARQACIKAGLPLEIPACTINTVCGSGLHAVGLAYNAVMAGQISFAIAGGMENMSKAPYLLKEARNGYRLGNGELVDSLVTDGLTCPFNNYHMGITAENIAQKYSLSREEQDAFAFDSQMKAATAQKEGRFEDEILNLRIKRKKEEIIFNQDEYIRKDTSLEKLAALRPAFKNDGTVTAGNASGINDGAAALLVGSENRMKELGVSPFASITGFSLVGLDPAYMGMGPVDAIKSLLKKTAMKIEDIGLFEINEAFAAQSLAVIRELSLPAGKVNVNGGAIALGHPVGASGARILVTLLHEMKRREVQYGIAALCIGSGMGIAMMVENAL